MSLLLFLSIHDDFKEFFTLDVPRSRLAKYPLLLKQILKYSDCSTESESLTASIEALNGILKDVDAAMAQSRCKFTVNRLEWLEENVTPDISVLQANEEILEGTLRNNRGTVRRENPPIAIQCMQAMLIIWFGFPTEIGVSPSRYGVHPWSSLFT